MAIEGSPKITGVVFTKELQRTVGEKNPTKQSVFVGYKLDENGHKVKVRYTGDGQELVEKTTIGKNTYVTKKEADALIMQMLGTSSVPKGVTVKYETDQNGTTSPTLLFQGEKLDAKGMRELALITNAKDEMNKNLAEAAKNMKIADIPKEKLLAKVELPQLKIQTPTPQGAKTTEAEKTDKKPKIKRQPNNIKGKARASEKSQEVINRVKNKETEKTGTLDDTIGIKKPEDTPTRTNWGGWAPAAPTPEEVEQRKKDEQVKAQKEANWKKAIKGGNTFRDKLYSRNSNPYDKSAVNSDTIRGFIKGAGGPSIVNRVWTSNITFIQKKAILIDILSKVKGHGMQNATVKTNGQRKVTIDELIGNIQKSGDNIISPEDRRMAFVFIQNLMQQ